MSPREDRHPDWSDENVLKGACVAYNSGVSNVVTIAGMNRGTTHNDYGDDVIARAQFYHENLVDRDIDHREVQPNQPKSKDLLMAETINVLDEYQNSLKEMGLIDDESLKNPVVWIRERLSQIFN